MWSWTSAARGTPSALWSRMLTPHWPPGGVVGCRSHFALIVAERREGIVMGWKPVEKEMARRRCCRTTRRSGFVLLLWHPVGRAWSPRKPRNSPECHQARAWALWDGAVCRWRRPSRESVKGILNSEKNKFTWNDSLYFQHLSND